MRQLAIILFLAFNISAFSQTPTVAASNIKFDFTGCNEVEISWTNGNGSDRVVFMRESSAVNDVPEYNQYYTENNTFGVLGETIKNDNTNWCVYRGPGNKVTVKGLKKLTKYCIAIFEYNGGGGIYDYKVDAYPAACVTTKNIVAEFRISDASGKTYKYYDTAQHCQWGNTFKFNNKSYSDETPISYRWYFGDGDSSKQPNPTHSYTKSNIMKVKLIAEAKGCYTSVIRNDTVHPHPVAKFDLDPALLPKNNDTQCYFGNRFTFKNTTTLEDIGAGVSSMRYEWYEYPYDDNDSFFATGYKADRNFPTAGHKKVRLVVISNRGCRDSTEREYDVLPRAIDPVKVIFNQKSMCLSNNLFTFENKSSNSITSNWRYRDSADKKNLDSSFLNPTSYSFKKTGKYYITLRAYDAAGCLDEHLDSINVFKNANVFFTGLSKQHCLNDFIDKLVPTPSGGKFFGQFHVKTDSTFTPASIGKFYVGYESNKSGCRDTAWDSTVVYDKPLIELGPDVSICKDVPLQLNMDPVYVSTWGSSPPISGVNGYTGPYVNISQSARYWVKVSNPNCSSYDTITIKALNTPTLKPSRDTSLCGGSYLKFSLKVDDGTVVWNDGNTSRDRIIGQSGFYKVYVSNKCGTASDSFNLNVEETACIVFFPNAFTPNGDVLNDKWQPSGKYDFIQMNIFNRWGERVYFSDKSPVWDGYNGKDLCLEGVYNIVFEYLMHEGNSMKRVTQGIPVHLIK
ncbi:MAG: PKD domain-containing protein [Bacteroidia bacterium]